MGDDWDDTEGDEWKLLNDPDTLQERALELYKEDIAKGPALITLGKGDRVLVRSQYLPDADANYCYEWEIRECTVRETTPDQVFLAVGRNNRGRLFWLDRRLLLSVVHKAVQDDPPRKKPAPPTRAKKRQRST